MLSIIEIENFKCLHRFSQPLGALTLLTGPNAAGKSSVIQSLALLHQSAFDNEWTKAVQLNGSSLELGSMYDVIDRNSGGNGFSVSLGTNQWKCRWETTSSDRKRELVAQINRVIITESENIKEWTKLELETIPIRRLVPENASNLFPHIYRELQKTLFEISYISAERLGPREVYEARTPMILPNVGSRGEHTASCLEQFADNSCNPGLLLPGIADNVRLTLLGWMKQMFPGVGLETRVVEATNLIVMGIRTSPKGDLYRPINVGFGITQTLPIITACVTAIPGRILLIENPETHLHPATQSLMGTFLALSASRGVQVVVETHSDHVLNGIRRAIRDRKLPAQDTKIYFFQSQIDDNNESQVSAVPIEINELGRLNTWPLGFFDQFEADLDHIFRE